MHKRTNKLIIFGGIAIIGLAAAGVFINSQYVLPIAMYHSVQPVVPEGNRLIVSTKVFNRQMQFLKKNKYAVLPLEQAAVLIAQKKKIPSRAVVLTFDDGNIDNYTYAFPVLKKYGLPATIFLVVNDIGKPDKLNWDQIKEMQGSGLITFGSHSMSHPFLECIIDPTELTKEILGSKQALEISLARPVLTFSYPCGRLNKQVRQKAVEAGYKAAVVTNPGKSIANDDVFALKRLRISENAGNLFVFWFETTGYYNFIRENRHK
jgi:peptidoglycan/xylan/chitin deacetylase (PgdA/CDA1 family)